MEGSDWTPALVEARLIEAAAVMKRLPPVHVRGYFTLWPAIVPEFGDLVGQEPLPLRQSLPPPDAITRMDRTLEWLRWLEPEDVKLVWARAERLPWKAVCWQCGVARATAHRRWDYALNLIAWRLNGRSVTSKQSRAALMDRVRFLSSE